MATFTPQEKSSTETFVNQGQGSYSATAGQYVGFGAFNYSGGQALITNNTVFTNQTKN